MSVFGKPQTERKQLSREEWLAEVMGDIDPEKFAGEGWFATEEYSPGDVADPFVAGEIGKEGDYYPGKQSTEDERQFLLKLLRRQE